MNKVLMIAVGYVMIAFTANVQADQLVHKFKSPSFSGIGTGAHYLTIENQEKRKII